MNLVEPLNESLKFSLKIKALPTTGNMAWEYNPLRNYRLNDNKYYFRDKYYSQSELIDLFEVNDKNEAINQFEETSWKWFYDSENCGNPIIQGETEPVLYKKGQLIDFDTDELQFSLKHPVEIQPQYSYDNSVNLILNDGYNQPRLINTRFSAIGRDKYEIVDRKGDNDTNIYDQGEQFEIDTSLYKRTIKIPKLEFKGVYSGGNLPVGNYHFYFKYADADGNETDWIAESGMISIFIGTTPNSINGGFENQNSHKLIRFRLTNLDTAYSYIKVYYSKETSGIDQESKTTCYSIDEKFLVNQNKTCTITVSGFVNPKDVSPNEINTQYEIVSDAETQAICKSMLFLGNVHKPDIPYTELTDLSLYFLPYANYKDYNLEIDSQYNISSITNGYYDPTFIYNFTGYWYDELYRLGVVYILPDNTLSPVFNIRGAQGIKPYTKDFYYQYKIKKGNDRSYINVSEEDFLLVHHNATLENAKGVITIDRNTKGSNPTIYGIEIRIDKEPLEELKKYVKGFFFVRQKRMVTTLCQALSIGTDKCNNTPVIPIGDKNELIAKQMTNCNYTYKELPTLLKVNEIQDEIQSVIGKFPGNAGDNYFVEEAFLDSENRYLNGDFFTRLRPVSRSLVNVNAALCPEAEIDQTFYSHVFTGDTFKAVKSDFQPSKQHFDWGVDEERNFYIEKYNYKNEENTYSAKVLYIPDSSKTMAIGRNTYKGIVGNAIDGWRFDYIGHQNKVQDATNLIRGAWGPYLGFTGASNTPLQLYDIKIPGYSKGNMSQYFNIRYHDNSGFYPISDRFDISEVETNVGTFYRGDCYICQFTHRMNRNFQDPSAPTNDLVVDEKCWYDNYTVKNKVIDKSKFSKINIGDLNSIPLGMWVTFTIRATKNLCLRSIDDSHSEEKSLVGHGRGFYPYQSQCTDGAYKTPEALCFNKGFQKDFGVKVNVEAADVPYLKNEYSNRILYSNPAISDAFTNNLRVFEATHFKDYSKEYGSITKIVEQNDNLVIIFEHGIGVVAVNEKALLQNAQGQDVHVGTKEVLGEPTIISDKYGSQWKDSIIKTPYYIYGVDTVAKKIWRVAESSEHITCISDFKIQQFLNKNITLGERENSPILGIRNVKTHYNAFKSDVMFTFYDNLYGFEEKAWNVCWNELTQVWTTMYSWIPSFSDNIYNQYFSFNRDISKWISKLGMSKASSSWSEGIVVKEPYLEINSNNCKVSTKPIAKLGLKDRDVPEGYSVVWSIEHDNFGNYKYFSTTPLTEELAKEDDFLITTEDSDNIEITENDAFADNRKGAIYCVKDYPSDQINPVILLNIKATLVKNSEEYAGDTYKILTKLGAYSNTIALCFKDIWNATRESGNRNAFDHSFWKHGQAGLQDIAEKITPCKWYGEQHPFEFEFCVNEYPELQKTFDNLMLVGNDAEPESFHFEIVGDQLKFSADKKNMFIRQEATKELYQYNGSDVLFDSDYRDMEGSQLKVSTILPMIYEQRIDTFNQIYDTYKQITATNKNYDALTGSEVTYDSVQDSYNIWVHQKAIDVRNGRLRGNMIYNRDNWYIQIRPINFAQKEEDKWVKHPPITIANMAIPKEVNTNVEIPTTLQDYTIDASSWGVLPMLQNKEGYIYGEPVTSASRQETKIRDKFIKIRIRYSGEKLAIIRKIITAYNQSL